jgi:hypothetical protein
MRLGTSLALARIGRSAAAPFTPASLFASAEPGAWYDASDLTSMFQDSAGTTPAVVDAVVGKWNDKSGRGNHATQATTAAKPILRQAGALYYLEFDGVDDKWTVPTMVTIGSTASIITGMLSTDTAWMLLSNSALGNPLIAVAQSANGSATSQAAGTPVFKVNRVALSANTRGGLYTDVAAGSTAKVLTITAVDCSALNTPLISGYASGGFELTGRIYQMVLAGTLTAPNIAATETYIAGKAGVTL